MKKETKRYLITYTDGNIGVAEASSILGGTKRNYSDGKEFMMSEQAPGKEDVLHFENLGISNAELTDEEVTKLSKKAGILAVEEDREMFALGEITTDQESEELWTEDLPSLYQSRASSSEPQQRGYDQALIDVFAAILKANKGSADTIASQLNRFATPLASQPTPWNMALINAPVAWARNVIGNGVKVAVLDTGITSHPDLIISGGASFVPGENTNDINGHGTHCAGIIGARNNSIGVVGVAPGCRLYAVKVLKHNPATGRASGFISWIIAGMEWCITNGIKVASMSLGGEIDPTVAYSNAIKRCQDRGITVVVAAGNSFTNPFKWVNAPANSIMTGSPNASPLAVAAVDRARLIASFSSRGGRVNPWNQVTVSAPGVAVNSTYLRNGYISMSGTSMACPHVAGLVALLLQRFPALTPAQIKARIRATARDLGTAGNDITYGAGLIDCNRATA